MAVWEYLRVEYDGRSVLAGRVPQQERLDSFLNTLGAMGWELVGFSSHAITVPHQSNPFPSTTVYELYIFKRLKQK